MKKINKISKIGVFLTLIPVFSFYTIASELRNQVLECADSKRTNERDYLADKTKIAHKIITGSIILIFSGVFLGIYNSVIGKNENLEKIVKGLGELGIYGFMLSIPVGFAELLGNFRIIY